MTASMASSWNADDLSQMAERFFGERRIRLQRVPAGADRGDPLVDHRRGVRHRPDDACALGEAGLERGGRDRRRHREEGFRVRPGGADLVEEGRDVLRLDGGDDEFRPGDGGVVFRQRLDAVGRRSSSSRSGRRPVTTTSSGVRQFELRKPRRRASPSLPAPRIATVTGVSRLRSRLRAAEVESSHSRPNFRIALMIGRRARPLSVSSYSTRGGDSG